MSHKRQHYTIGIKRDGLEKGDWDELVADALTELIRFDLIKHYDIVFRKETDGKRLGIYDARKIIKLYLEKTDLGYYDYFNKIPLSNKSTIHIETDGYVTIR